MKKKTLFLILALILMNLSNLLSAQQITTGSLINEMIDMHRLIEFPDPSYKTIQFSSYDHRSTVPNGPHWFGNDDGFGGDPVPNFEQVLREPDTSGVGEYLICDVKGPGAIVRLWTAAIAGTIRFYLDEAKEPLYDGPAEKFFFHTYESIAPGKLDKSTEVKGSFLQEMAGYYPIPFAKNCRIRWIGNIKDLHFYHVQVRLYEPNAEVITFSPGDLNKYSNDIKNVSKILLSPNSQWKYQAKNSPFLFAGTIPFREKKELLTLKGAMAIERFTLKLYAQDLDKALRQCVLFMSFDGSPWGQVQAPVGDFFGAAPGINPYDSVPLTVLSDGTMICRYVMPFKDSLKVMIDNRGEQQVTVTGSVLSSDYTWEENKSMYFRALWRVDHGLFGSYQRPQDLPYLLANGKGVCVGAACMLMNPANAPTSWGNWWGEGDEKIFVDNDKNPSTFGTGSEDYYNYAWSSSDIFIHPYCGQPRNDGPGNRGFVTNYRWHIIDDLPFHNRFGFYMELYTHEPTQDISYARIVYHYGMPGMTDDHTVITDRDVEPIKLPENWYPIATKGSNKALFYQAEELVANDAEFTYNKNNLWSGGRLFVWHPKAKKDQLKLNIPISEDGEYFIRFTAAKHPHAGIFSAKINNVPLKFNGDRHEVNLEVPFRTLSRNFSAQPVKLSKGSHELLIENVNDNVQPIGIDFLWIQPKRFY